MKHHFSKIFILLTLLLFGVNTYAEEIIVGNGDFTGTTTYAPFYGTYDGGWTESLFTQDELSQVGINSGEITSLAMFLKTAATRTSWGTVSIWLANTSLTTLPSGKTTKEASASYELVYQDLATDVPFFTASNNNSWLTYQFISPFEYTGDGLLVYICYYGGAWGNAGPNVRATSFTANTKCYMRYADGISSSACGTALTYNPSIAYRVDMKFDIQMGPMVKGLYPAGGELFGSSSQTGDIIVPYMEIDRKEGHPTTQYQYQVLDYQGNIAFEALDPVTNDNWIDLPANDYSTGTNPDITFITKYFKKARGPIANISNPDTAKISFRSSTIVEGEYTVIGRVKYQKDGADVIKEMTSKFEVAYQDDIGLMEISEPLSYDNTTKIYPFSDAALRIAITVQNRGVHDINEYKVHYLLEKVNPISGQRDVIWQPAPTFISRLMKRGETQVVENNDFIPKNIPGLTPGTFYLTIRLELLGATEENLGNNSNATVPVDVKFEYPYDGVMVDILVPTDSVYTNQPVLAAVKVRNEGGFVASEIPITVKVMKAGVQVGEAIVEAIDYLSSRTATDGTNERIFEFATPFALNTVGADYQIVASISTENDIDPTPNNNQKTASFKVVESLTGTHAIGKNYEYKTIAEALNAVYRMGVNGTVTFELSDPVIEVGNIDSTYALDFSSSIAGFSVNNLIKFVPSRSLSRVAGGVTLRLSSNSGMGIRFGSSVSSEFPAAPVNRVKFQAKADYYPFNARVEFDGGENQSIRFIQGNVPTAQTNSVLLYFTEGASNVTIKNCLLEGQTTANVEIPLVLWNRERNEFTYDPVKNLSTCILMRSLPPMDEDGLNRTYSLDTLVNRNIIIQNNVLEGGGYGIVSLGIGGLYNSGAGQFQRYYNINNHIVGNTIIGQTRAGIYMGYEERSRVANNRIYYVGQNINLGDQDIAGIILGGEANAERFGYNNVGVMLNGNEISAIKSNNDVYGIKVEQNRNNFPDMHIEPDGSHPYMPDVPDSLKIFNNLVWDITTGAVNGSRYGIRLFTTRDTTKLYDPFFYFATPKEFVYDILGANIINNSVIIEDDNMDNGSAAFIGGILAQNVDSMQFYNNAIDLLDTASTSDVVAPVVLQSMRPSQSNIQMNNNIYYNSTPDSALIRFIEHSQRDNSIISYGYRDEFTSLEQWQYWGGADTKSYIYNFYRDIYTKITNKIPSMRIKSPVPVGSYLNNRGKVLPEVATDIDLNPRGAADQEYDIGAWEFDGILFANDLAILGFASPLSFRDTKDGSPFADAEYVMTKSPVKVQVNIRNNGSNFAADKTVRLSVYLDESNTKVLDITKNITIGAFETKTLDFQTDVASLVDRLFKPIPYAKIPDADIPDRFAMMANNVTPVYRFEVQLPYDEDNTNNTNSSEKLVRFYIKASNLYMLVAGENTNLVPDSVKDYFNYIRDNVAVTTDEDYNKVAGFCNYKAVKLALDTLNYSHSENGYDIFDRANWEERSVNYTDYKTIFWADGLNATLTEYQEDNIDAFLALATYDVKRNLILSSEELARNSYAIYTDIGEEDYFRTLFNTKPLGDGIRVTNFDADGYDWLTGAAIAQNKQSSFNNTPLVNANLDKGLQAAIFEQVGSYTHQVEQAMFYTRPLGVNRSNKTMGTASYSAKDILIYLGLDWRHYTKPASLLSSIIDFIEAHGSNVVPVELVGFDAFVANNKVHLNWSTCSETNNKDVFIVEKADINAAGVNEFEQIDAVKARGVASDYNSIDANVKSGGQYAYRLKFIDANGEYNYSNERIVKINESNFVSLEPVTPNPVKNTLDISFALAAEMDIKLGIYDVNGNAIAIIRDGTFEGKVHAISFDVTHIPSGAYSLILFTNGNSVSQPFTIAK